MASGMSAAIVSRIGLPLSHVSASAIFSRFASMRSAILLSICARSAGLVRPPGLFRGVRGVESGLDVRRVGASDLADRLAGDRRDVVDIFAGFGRPPLAADIVLVTFG